MARRRQAAASDSLFGDLAGAGPEGWLNRLLRPVDALGAAAVGLWLALADSVGFAAALLAMAVRPRTWRRTVVRQFMRQCYDGGVRAVPMIIVLGVLAGAGLVAQALTLLRLAGQEDLAGQFLALVLFREISPVLIGLLMVGRTGAAMIAELGALRINRQLHGLDAAGVDPVVYLVLPAVLGMTVAATVLAVLFAASAFISGFVLAFVLGYGRGNLVTAADAAAGSASPVVYLILLVKSMLIGLAIGVICGQRGLRVEAVTDLPRALAAGFIWSVVAVFVISGSITALWEFLI